MFVLDKLNHIGYNMNMTHADSSITLPAFSDGEDCRHDCWSPVRQRRFCEVLAETGRVGLAAKAVGLSRQGAYQFRRRPDGQAFRLAWDAALILARQRLIDDAMELAFEGSHEVIIKDGEVVAERRKRDGQSVLKILSHLTSQIGQTEPHAALVAGDFDGFLDIIDGTIARNDPHAAVAGFITDHGGKPSRKAPARNHLGHFLPTQDR
jgi:hypothetical protein